MNKLANFYYKAVEGVLTNKELLLNQAIEICDSMLHTFTLKAAQFNSDAARKLNFIRAELNKAAAYLDNPSAETFIRLMEINDDQSYLEQLKVDLYAQSDELLKFKSVAHLYTKLSITVDDAEQHFEESLIEPDKLIKDIKFSIVYVWAFHNYSHVLRAAEKKLQDHILQNYKEQTMRTEVTKTENIKKEPSLTNAQKVLIITLLNKVFKINKSQEVKNLNIFIQALTGHSLYDIDKFARLANQNEFLISPSKKQNLIDLNAIRPFFEKLEQEQILMIIDQSLASANLMNSK